MRRSAVLFEKISGECRAAGSELVTVADTALLEERLIR